MYSGSMERYPRVYLLLLYYPVGIRQHWSAKTDEISLPVRKDLFSKFPGVLNPPSTIMGIFIPAFSSLPLCAQIPRLSYWLLKVRTFRFEPPTQHESQCSSPFSSALAWKIPLQSLFVESKSQPQIAR
jgi:hypothetical protein